MQDLIKFKDSINATKSLSELEEIRQSIFGKSGILTSKMTFMKNLDPAAKKEQGRILNEIKDELLNAIKHKKDSLEQVELEKKLLSEKEDVSLLTSFNKIGGIHPISEVKNRIISYFKQLGFASIEGPEIDDTWHNFDALNVPTDHPARSQKDTFYIENDASKMLRTHTSNVQIRYAKENKPPFRMISVGKVYRNDSVDSTHTPVFHQLEGLVIEPGITMAHLKGCLLDFCKHFFKKDSLKIRMRPSFFPFTEPSAEIDILFESKKESRWIELLGCGMVHPTVLKNMDLDPNEHQGFAFGMGIERLLMLDYGISDIRNLYESDIEFLSHFKTSVF